MGKLNSCVLTEIEMTDVDEIIYFIKSLKKGFDKDLFQSKVDDLAYAVDTNGLDYEDFHTLFKVWLNLSIREYLPVSLNICYNYISTKIIKIK